MLVFVRAGLAESYRLEAWWRRCEDSLGCRALKVLGEADLWSSGEGAYDRVISQSVL